MQSKELIQAIKSGQPYYSRDKDDYKYICNISDFLDGKSVYKGDRLRCHYQAGLIEETEEKIINETAKEENIKSTKENKIKKIFLQMKSKIKQTKMKRRNK